MRTRHHPGGGITPRGGLPGEGWLELDDCLWRGDVGAKKKNKKKKAGGGGRGGGGRGGGTPGGGGGGGGGGGAVA